MGQMKTDYCCDLEIPVSHPLKDPSVIHREGSEPDIFFVEHTDVSEEFSSWVDSLGLVMTYPPLIFYTPVGHQIGIHIDGPGEIVNRACINWCVQGAGSLMHWYAVKKDKAPFEESITQAGTPYTQYHPNDLIHLHSQPVKWPSIVQTGIPHNVHNSKWEPRWVISCDISTKDKPEEGLTYEQALEIFKQWIAT
jgi:hypothetical protein